MNNKILIINAGSSSIKWQLLNKLNLEVIASGLAERIAVDGKQDMKFGNNKFNQDFPTPNHKEAVKAILKLWEENNVIKNPEEITNVGFRIVHGGKYFSKPSILKDGDVEKIKDAGKFAPLHNPGAAQAIEAFKELFPSAILSANFDTGFHTTIPALNSTYPMNYELANELDIKKYGAHGISHRYITRKLESILKKDKVNFVNLHIGNGASLCAIKDSKSFDTSMGLTPLAGIMMGTRSGDIDPSIHEYVCEAKNISISEFTNILNKKSGLAGVSGISSDMRDIRKAITEGNERAKLAFEIYAQRIIDYTASFINKIRNSEAIVFTAGVGENDKLLRKAIIEGLAPFGLEIDLEANENDFDEYNLISTPSSKMKIYIMRTNEELMIAKDALELER